MIEVSSTGGSRSRCHTSTSLLSNVLEHGFDEKHCLGRNGPFGIVLRYQPKNGGGRFEAHFLYRKFQIMGVLGLDLRPGGPRVHGDKIFRRGRIVVEMDGGKDGFSEIRLVRQ